MILVSEVSGLGRQGAHEFPMSLFCLFRSGRQDEEDIPIVGVRFVFFLLML